MFNISLEHYLFLGAILFTFGVLGIFLNKKNVINQTIPKPIPKYKLMQQSIPIYVATPFPPLNFSHKGKTWPINTHKDET